MQNQAARFRNSGFSGRFHAVLLALLLGWLGAGCGYRFSGGGSNLPKEIQTVFVAPFINKSRDVSVGSELVSVFRSAIRQRKRLRIVRRQEDADAILSGVVRSLRTRVIAVSSEDEAIQFETGLVVDLSFRRRSPDELLWYTRGSRLVEVFSGSRGAMVTTSSDFKRGTLNSEDLAQFTDIQLTETLKEGARAKLVQKAAHELHHRLMEMF
ncbi:MAG: LPS assembly lipoprotein LptE [Candidatus Binatia bacterium]|jgi:hypothetical protein|nr:LPS assembly lipoprotein LptE [Candidatus Binatia bacterium]